MSASRRIFVTGATGFVGQALVPALLSHGHLVRAGTRSAARIPASDGSGAQWATLDLLKPETLRPALEGCEVAYYLVHSMGPMHRDFRERDRRAAMSFAQAAEDVGLSRIIYLGGVSPQGRPSPHLQSRLEVGQILRSGAVPTLELRASMIIGPGSASWQIVRDLALRVPALLLPTWMRSRTRPIALEDVLQALLDALDVPLQESAWFDLPGPDTLSGREILEHIAALRGRRLPAVELPGVFPRVAAQVLRLVSRGDTSVARELVMGFTHDLLPRDERWYALTGHPPRVGFDLAAEQTLAKEKAPTRLLELGLSVEEILVDLLGPKLRGSRER